MKAFADVLNTHPTALSSLQTLKLDDNNLKVQGMRALASIFFNPASLPQLKELTLKRVNAYEYDVSMSNGPKIMKVFASIFTTCPTALSRLQILDLRTNYIRGDAIKAFADIFIHKLPHTPTLLPQLRVLDLSDNKFGTDGRTPDGRTSYDTPGLSGNDFTITGMSAFASIFTTDPPSLPQLQILNLKLIGLYDNGMRAFADIFTTHPTALSQLRTLNLSLNHSKDKGLEEFASIFTINPTVLPHLEELNLHGHAFSAKAMMVFANIFITHPMPLPRLQILDFAGGRYRTVGRNVTRAFADTFYVKDSEGLFYRRGFF
jgi:Ran GTPase-activating protein (RanGAP) involved in mRNA processing and transport